MHELEKWDFEEREGWGLDVSVSERQLARHQGDSCPQAAALCRGQGARWPQHARHLCGLGFSRPWEVGR